MALELIVGIGICAALLLYLAVSMQKHQILQILLVLIVSSLLILIPKAAIDDKCPPALVNETVVGNTTFYSYSEVCVQDNITATTLLKGLQLFRICLVMYLLLYLVFELFFKKKLEKPGQGWIDEN